VTTRVDCIADEWTILGWDLVAGEAVVRPASPSRWLGTSDERVPMSARDASEPGE
jgi:hypothetical protein